MIEIPRSSDADFAPRYRFWSSSTVPMVEQFDYWVDTAQSVFGPMRIERDDAEGFRTSVSQVKIASVTLSSVEAQSHRASRDSAMARRADSGLVYLNVPLVGTLSGRQRARNLAPTGGWMGMLLGDESATLMAESDFQQLVVGIPSELVVPRLADSAASRVVTGALTGFLGQMIKYLFVHASEFGGDEARQVAVQLTDLVVECFGSSNSEPSRARPAVILQAAMDEAERRLADPALNADVLARHANVSRRTLEKLFADRGTTVARWVLQRRLEHARSDLETELYANLSIESIAQRWAFADRTHFSRVFLERYQMPPAAYRRARLQGLASQ